MRTLPKTVGKDALQKRPKKKKKRKDRDRNQRTKTGNFWRKIQAGPALPSTQSNDIYTKSKKTGSSSPPKNLYSTGNPTCKDDAQNRKESLQTKIPMENSCPKHRNSLGGLRVKHTHTHKKTRNKGEIDWNGYVFREGREIALGT